MTERATLRQIAEELHVAESTVSRALSGKKGVNEQTRRRILALARRSGYVARLGPIRLPAQVVLLAEQRTLQDKHFWGHVTSGLVSEISMHDSYFSVFVTDADSPTFVPPPLLEQVGKVNGVIAIHATDRRAVHLAVDLGFPVVLVNCQYDHPACDAVFIDDSTGVYGVANELIKMGHRRFGFVGGLMGHSSRMRYNGLTSALMDAGVTGEIPPMRCTIEELERCALPTALICSNDILAVEAIRVLMRRNVHVPADVSVVGFDDDPETIAECPVPLTTLHVDQEELGRWAVRTLFQRLNNPDSPAVQVILKVTPVWRESCAKPPAVEGS